MSKKNSDSLPQEQIVSNVSKVRNDFLFLKVNFCFFKVIERVKSLVGKDILVISIFDEDLKMGERKVRETVSIDLNKFVLCFFESHIFWILSLD